MDRARPGQSVRGAARRQPYRTDRIILTRPGRHEAQFLTPDRKPIPNLPVKLVNLSGDGGTIYGNAFRFLGGYREGKTDAEGKFVVTGLPQGMWAFFRHESADWALLSQQVIPGRPTFRVRYALSPAATVSGTALLPDGTPAANALVRAIGLPLGGDVYHGGSAQTDAAGRYTVRGLAPGRYRVSISAHPDTLSARPLAVEAAHDRPATGVDFGLARSGMIEGVVTDAATGKPLRGVLMQAGAAIDDSDLSSENAFTDTKGAYRLRVAPGRTWVQPEYETLRPGLADPPRRQVAVGEGQTVRVDYALPAKPYTQNRTSVNGTVYGADGKPVKNAALMYFADIPNPGIVTDAEGRFRIASIITDANSIRLTARKGEDAATATVPTGGEREVTLRLTRRPLAVLRGVVTDEKGKPILGATVRISSEEKGASFALPFGSVKTNAQGRFAAPVRPEYEHFLDIRAKGYGYSLVPKTIKPLLRLAPGEKRDVGRITLAQTDSFVAGKVVDAAGKPLARMRVGVNGKSTQSTAISDAEGRFRLEGVVRADERLWLSVQSPDGVSGLWTGYRVPTGTSDNIITLTEEKRYKQ